MGKLDHVKGKVVKMLAVGKPQTSIAEQIRVNQSDISRFANKDETKVFIEEVQLRIAAILPNAVENIICMNRIGRLQKLPSKLFPEVLKFRLI